MNVTNLKAARRPVEGNQDEFVILDQDSKEVASIKGDSEITLSLTLNGLEFVSPPQSKMIIFFKKLYL